FHLPHGVVIAGVLGVDRVHIIPGDVVDDTTGRELLRQPDLERVHAGHVVNDDADLAAVLGYRRLPFGVAEAFREREQSGGSLLEHRGEGCGPMARGCGHCFYCGDNFWTRIHRRAPPAKTAAHHAPSSTRSPFFRAPGTPRWESVSARGW